MVHIVEFRDLFTRQDHLTCCLKVSASSFEEVAEIEGTDFILRSALLPILPHGHNCDPANCYRAQRPCRGGDCDKGSREHMLRRFCGCSDALGAGARSLDNGDTAEIDLG